jgi:phosphoglycerol transferase
VNKIVRSAVYAIFIIGASALLAGCDNKPDAKPPAVAAPSVSVKPLTDDPLGPRYVATLAEGIDFKRQGFPTFIEDIKGISIYESWGRWGIGASTTFIFKEELPKTFKLTINVDTLYPNQNIPIKVKVNNIVREFTITEKTKTFALDFGEHNGAKTIEFIAPKPISPKEIGMNEDMRILSIAFNNLRIE